MFTQVRIISILPKTATFVVLIVSFITVMSYFVAYYPECTVQYAQGLCVPSHLFVYCIHMYAFVPMCVQKTFLVKKVHILLTRPFYMSPEIFVGSIEFSIQRAVFLKFLFAQLHAWFSRVSGAVLKHYGKKQNW